MFIPFPDSGGAYAPTTRSASLGIAIEQKGVY
jgi:hypothetical protein